MEKYGDKFAISTSFQSEGMVLVDMAARINPAVRVMTLDTGRLPGETYQMMETVRDRYGIAVEVVVPEAAEIEAMVALHGPNLFYRQGVLRNLCCHFRKVRPLDRKMVGLEAWAAGLRRSQNETRAAIPKVDSTVQPVKLSPLADWSAAQVEEYTSQHHVPRHPLYAQGYASIGCAPCTRPIQPGEAERAGRWWWETEQDKECGIHFSPDGRATRQLDVLIADIRARTQQ